MSILASDVAKRTDAVVSGAVVAHVLDMLEQGRASRLDVYVAVTTASLSLVPGAGEAAGFAQLAYDLADPMLSIVIPNVPASKTEPEQ